TLALARTYGYDVNRSKGIWHLTGPRPRPIELRIQRDGADLRLTARATRQVTVCLRGDFRIEARQNGLERLSSGGAIGPAAFMKSPADLTCATRFRAGEAVPLIGANGLLIDPATGKLNLDWLRIAKPAGRYFVRVVQVYPFETDGSAWTGL